MIIRNFLVLVSLLTFLSCGSQGVQNRQDGDRVELEPSVLLISIDGFRWDYFEKAATPNFDRLIENGVKASSLIPVFPTKTFPNHYSIVTGLYAENHGVVSNNMYDPVFDERFSLSNQEAIKDGKWWGGEPIWVTAEMQGQKAAAFFWPGSEAEIKGTRPSYYESFNSQTPHSTRIRGVVNWLTLPADERPTFVSLYFSNVDSRGHDFGPESPEVVQAIEDIDSDIGELLGQLEAEKLLDQLNIIITSDHGMTATDNQKVVFIDDYVDLSDISVTDWYPILGIFPADGISLDSLYQQLHGKHPEMDVYKKEDLPAKYHFNSHRRIPPILGVLSESWAATDRAFYPRLEERLRTGATHGWAPENKSMQGIFLGHGPAFKASSQLGEVNNVDIYELMCHILGLSPAENDGSLEGFQDVLNP